jgi:hypothetical protein
MVESRVAHDKKFVYFYVKTAKPLTPSTDKNWMLLYINTDTSKTTGWEGYDLLVNSKIVNQAETTVNVFKNGNWNENQSIKYACAGNELELALPVSWFSNKKDELLFSFHWVDNSQVLLEIHEFFVHGDSAPDRRFDYLYQAEPK